VLIRSKSEQTNFGMLLAQILRIEAAQWGQVLEDLKNMSFFVPFDIHSSVHLNHISIRLEDRLQDIQLANVALSELSEAWIPIDSESEYQRRDDDAQREQ
jgi:hypothetical protein